MANSQTYNEQGLNQFLEKMWTDYCEMNPQADFIFKSLKQNNTHVLNDHIALRTFNHKKLGLKSLSQHFEKYGYIEKGEYFFKEKKLYAKHYENKFDKNQPKIFISELECEKMSPFTQKIINSIVEQIPTDILQTESFIYSGHHWTIDYETYSKLADESEYASWVYAFGFRPNHFTVNINALNQFDKIADLNTYIKSLGIKLNASGGEIKGTPEELLEQSSTMAGEITVKFHDGEYKIPACYYEFAKRYCLPDGQLYQGFIAKSADKIFESTNRIK
ncbi:MAG: DUF1338 domain-containing protein [Pseudobdellovibrio sp.]